MIVLPGLRHRGTMFRRGIYFSELIPLLLAIAMLGMAVFGLATGRVPSV